MFGNASGPSKIYAYFAKPPTENRERVGEQILLAHRYRNRLVEIERKRREACAAVVRQASPELARAEEHAAALTAELEAAEARVKAAKGAARSRKADPAGRAALADLRKRRKAAWAAAKELRAQAYASPEAVAGLAAADEAAATAVREARAASGLYWGNYLPQEQSMQGARSGAPPDFRRWTGEGKVAVQLQGGLAVADLVAGGDARLRIEPLPDNAFDRGAPPRLRRAVCRLRVGSAGREPVWATVPFLMHRPLPGNGRVKWAYLHRRRVGTAERWELQFVVESEAGWPATDRATEGVVGVNAGWRVVPGGLRVAYWAGSDGAEGEVVLPESELSRWRKAEEVQGVRDGLLNGARDVLAAWLAGEAEAPAWTGERVEYLSRAGDPHSAAELAAWRALAGSWAAPRSVPEAFWARIGKPGAEATVPQRLAWLRGWRSAARLAGLALWWRENRFDGDGAAFAALEAWRRKDKHLCDWAAFARLGAVRARRERYRLLAGDLRRRYGRIVTARAGSARTTRRPLPESGESVNEAAQYNARVAAPGELVETLAESGAELADAANISRRCHACGHVNAWADAAALHQTCAGCGAVWDQDQLAALNLRDAPARGEAAPEPQEPLADDGGQGVAPGEAAEGGADGAREPAPLEIRVVEVGGARG